jgi:hypothetical protein
MVNMTAGILDLVAKGFEDIYLTQNPNITFFKTIYRRHTNFSIGEQDLHFTNSLDFDKEGYCRIEHYGDLLFRLYLVVRLPKIDLKYKKFSIDEIKLLLKKYDIVWNCNHTEFTHESFEEIKNIIENKITELKKEIDKFNQFKDTLNNKYTKKIWKLSSSSNNKYIDSIISDFIKDHKLSNLYKIIRADKYDIISNQVELFNSTKIKNLLYENILNSIVKNNNLKFYNEIYTSDLNTDNIFTNDYSEYETFDTYKIFNYTLHKTNAKITNVTEAQKYKLFLMQSMKEDMINNIKIIKKIYRHINEKQEISIYNKYPSFSITHKLINLQNLPKTCYQTYIEKCINNYNYRNSKILENNVVLQYLESLDIQDGLDKLWIKMTQDIKYAINEYVKCHQEIVVDLDQIEDDIIKKISKNTNFITPEKLLVDNTLIYDYIIAQYLKNIPNHRELVQIINQFKTPIDQIPPHDNYQNIPCSTHLKTSIFCWILDQFINSYNLFYSDLLDLTFFENEVGSETTNYLKYIKTQYFCKTDFFRLYIPNNEILDFLDSKIVTLQQMFSEYDHKKSLLEIKKLPLYKPELYFKEFNDIVTLILNSLALNHEKEIYLNEIGQQYCPNDILIKIKSNLVKFISNLGIENPYSSDQEPHKYELWEEINQEDIDGQKELDRFNKLFGWLYNDFKLLFNQKSKIDVMYNSFNLEKDVYDYITDFIVENTSGHELVSLSGHTINQTFTYVQTFCHQKYEKLKKLLHVITGENGGLSLINTIKRAFNCGSHAKFAWIRKIGHYLIDKVYIKFDDQLIDKQYGEWMEIWHSLTKSVNKEKGYKRLIGDVHELYTFNNKPKREYELIIPLQFWFCREIGASLPLIALHNTEIKIYVKLKSFDEVCYYEPFTVFKKKPKLKCHLLSEYIYLEKDERCKLSSSKLEYIIDTLQYNDDILISKSNFQCSNLLKTTIRFKNSCKELFWVVQNKKFIDGSLRYGERRWDLYSYDLEGKINPMKIFKIKFNDRYREKFKDSMFYNYIQSYERHNSDPDTGVNIYSFSLEPESLQPTGAVNMSRIDDTDLLMYLKKIVVDDIIKHNTVYRWGVYGLTINILRVFSGLGGLVFIT